jgi:hypothetical protein
MFLQQQQKKLFKAFIYLEKFRIYSNLYFRSWFVEQCFRLVKLYTTNDKMITE